MGLPAQFRGQGAQERELPGSRAEVGDVAAAGLNRRGHVVQRSDRQHRQRPHDRQDHAAPSVHDHQDQHARAHRDPEGAGERIEGEVGAQEDLVREGEGERCVDQQVDEVPRLVGEVPSDEAEGQEGDQQHPDGPHGGHRHELLLASELGDRVAETSAARVGDGGGDDVGHEQQGRRLAQPAVPQECAVEPDRPLEAVGAGGEGDPDERDRSREESRQGSDGLPSLGQSRSRGCSSRRDAPRCRSSRG